MIGQAVRRVTKLKDKATKVKDSTTKIRGIIKLGRKGLDKDLEDRFGEGNVPVPNEFFRRKLERKKHQR